VGSIPGDVHDVPVCRQDWGRANLTYQRSDMLMPVAEVVEGGEAIVFARRVATAADNG
jgi:hypothetical protein